MPGYRLVKMPTRIPAPGGKLIEEFFGRVTTKTDAFSLAHMVAPPGWTEPAQAPEFGELTMMVRGQMRIEAGPETLTIEAGQAFWAEPGLRVRYFNPFQEECEYFAVCIPAFAPDRVHREADVP